jgi:hypothetical protein
MTIIIGGGVSIGDGISVIPERPTTIGQAFGGGYYAGIMDVGVWRGTHSFFYIIVSPKETGEASGLMFNSTGSWLNLAYQYNGPINTAAMNSDGAHFEAAWFCGVTCNASGGINGYTDWYMPEEQENLVIYCNVKPTVDINYSFTNFPNGLVPHRDDQMTDSDPPQTSATIFRTGNSQAYSSGYYWSSRCTQYDSGWAQRTSFVNGQSGSTPYSSTTNYVRAVRRIPV